MTRIGSTENAASYFSAFALLASTPSLCITMFSRINTYELYSLFFSSPASKYPGFTAPSKEVPFQVDPRVAVVLWSFALIPITGRFVSHVASRRDFASSLEKVYLLRRKNCLSF